MARKAATTPAARDKKARPIGVYLRKSVRAEVERIAEAEGLTVHGVLAYAVSYFVRQYKSGKAKIETTKTINLDV